MVFFLRSFRVRGVLGILSGLSVICLCGTRQIRTQLELLSRLVGKSDLFAVFWYSLCVRLVPLLSAGVLCCSRVCDDF